MRKIRRDALDAMFSNYIRARAKWTCERCRKAYVPPTSALHCSHYHGRRKQSTRFDPDNCDCLCYGCHQHFGENREKYTKWKKEKLGEKSYDLLTLRTNIPNKPDRKLLKIWLKQELDNFKKEGLL